MAKQQGLQSWLQAPSPAPSKSSNTSKATKRKRRVTAIRESTPLDLGLISSAEEVSDVEERPRKKAGGEKKFAKKMADPKKQSAKAARQTYTSILGKVDKKVGELDRKCKAQGPNGRGFNSDNYAKAVAEFLPEVIDLSNMDGGVKFAFNLMLYLGEHAHGDFYMCVKMAGYGGSEKPYKALDEVMLGLIERRKDEATENDVQAVEATSLPLVPHRWTEADADVGEFKTGRAK